MSFLPSPWALCLLLVALPLMLTRALPAVLRLVGRGLTSSATPVASVLVLLEFWLASSLRRRGAAVPPVLHTYDRAVEAVYYGMRSGGPVLSAVKAPPPPVRLRWFVLLAALVLVVRYGEPLLPVGPARAQALSVKCGVMRADALVTGDDGWSGERAVCPLVPAIPAAGTPPPVGSPSGVLEEVATEGGRIVASGWAADPSDLAEAVEVRLHMDPGRLSARAVAIQADVARPHLAKARGLGPRAGFIATFPHDGKRHEVCAYAINIDEGLDALLGCKDVPSVA